MSAPVLRVLRAILSVRPRYECIDCGCRADGGVAVIELENPDSLGLLRAASIPSNTYMPIGWAGYGLDKHRCPDCAK